MKNRHFNLFSSFFVVFISFLVSIQTFSVQDSHAQWFQTNGPEGGYTGYITTQGNNIFAANIYGSLHRSTNNGDNWTLLSNGLNDIFFSALASNQSYVFIGADNKGVYRSSNNGENWHTANIGLGIPTVKCFAINENKIYAGVSNRGVYVSSNNGNSWNPVNTDISDKIIEKLVVNGTKLFAATQTEIYYSSNSGLNWSLITTNFTEPYIYSIAYGGGKLFASVRNGNTSGLYISTNDGQNWEETVLSNIYINTLLSKGQYLLAESFYGIFHSSNNGLTWSIISTELSATGVNVMAANDNYIFAGTNLGKNCGMYRSSNNGVNWVSINRSLYTQYIKTIISKDNNIFAGTYGGVFRSSNNGQQWGPANNGLFYNGNEDISIRKLLIFNNDLIAISSRRVYRSTNNGDSWTFIGNGLPDNWISTGITKGNSIFIAMDNGEIYHSSNLGTTWSQVNNGLDVEDINTFTVNNNDLYIGTSEGVFLTTNNGNNWTQKGLADKSITSIALNGVYIFAREYQGIYRSSNNGINWINITNGLDGFHAGEFITNGSCLFAIGEGGPNKNILLSTNNGTTWFNKSQGFANPINAINCLTITQDYIFAGTSAMSVWRREISDIVGIEPITGNIPVDYVLKQNYPNPFNPMTNIEFSIPNSGNVRIDVYDVSGKLVESLLNKNLSTGNYNVTWNASKFSSGIYFYKLTAGNFVQTKKMMLVK